MTPATDFRLYHGNALDVLAELLADELRKPVAGQSPLEPDIILVPQVAMRRWLQATLARKHGVAANLTFLTPGEFVSDALNRNLGTSDDDLDAASLHWRLYAALTDADLLAKPAMAQIAAYLGHDDPLKPWTLAGELASVFEKYQAWRRDWLLRWEDGADAGDPQALLWRAIVGGRSHRARRIQAYIARFVDGAALPVGLPQRLFAFGTLNVSPDVLRVLASQARVGTLHFYLPTPTRGYWGDLQAGRHAQPDEGENPLLRDWGAAGRDFMALLGSEDAVRPSGEIDACVDPDASTAKAMAAGGLRDSLLHRLQSDLFHRRADASGDRRKTVDPDDPSLQFHACHTRLRELQVLHDRLRALLEDPRFDPPLQPREIAVLAPDIDPYLPYLDAVFGAQGQGDAAPGQAIPYARADASPLAEDPLAEVFLRLLALPISRFGLEEMLDLLASAPLAEAAGLEPDDIDRLRGWLHAAGARWGIDAAHRERSGAPADATYTWQFALDRLLLGHASGDDDLIGEVAPWPELEGGALDALDRLIRQLRALARHEKTLGEAASPDDWRDRLLSLLQELLPETPAAPAAQRALERLRSLVNDFARRAGKAGFDAPVPAEVVRAHFAAVLGEADTRAPLLTGGVSFARMVPMRLLPFRAICLLGMNEGDFPRRDPAAGLSLLTSEIASGKRRPGDRSTREDDRYLFLQLFAAAEEVFHVSWLGRDPRDGSAREPSVLVTELLAAAGAYHANPDEAAKRLVLAHPLQPFSPEAFGAGDARRFSYRAHWQAAANRLGGERRALAPWASTDLALPEGVEHERDLPLGALRRFLLDPAAGFLRQRLGMRLPEIDELGEDIEPLQGPSRGLEKHALQRAVFEALLRGDDEETMQHALQARGLLPSGPSGGQVLQDMAQMLVPYARRFAEWRGDAQATSLPLDVAIDGIRLHDRLADVYPQGIVRLRFDAPNGPSVIKAGLDWLLASAAGVDLPLIEFHEDKDAGIGPHRRAPLDRDRAKDALRALIALRAQGLQRPLVFAPRSGWKLMTASNFAAGVREAGNQWHGSARQWAEAGTPAYATALRGIDPFADRTVLREFVENSHTVFGAVCDGGSRATPVDEAAVFQVTLREEGDE